MNPQLTGNSKSQICIVMIIQKVLHYKHKTESRAKKPNSNINKQKSVSSFEKDVQKDDLRVIISGKVFKKPFDSNYSRSQNNLVQLFTIPITDGNENVVLIVDT